MSYIKVTSEQLSAVSGQLQSAAMRIADDNMVALGYVNGLHGSDWAGQAADEFNRLFLLWKAGADQVQMSLTGIGALLDSAAGAYASAEQQITDAMG
jgi:WXG100 family type VII secretion target